MLYFTTILALAAAVMASPTGTPPPSDTPTCPGTGGGGSGTPTPIDVCPDGLYSNPQCCATDVLGAVGLNCAVRKSATSVSSVDDFISTCSTSGQQAKCCVVPVADQALLCQDVSPSA